jgi:tetratricopeptide (TPR) repeat protein
MKKLNQASIFFIFIVYCFSSNLLFSQTHTDTGLISSYIEQAKMMDKDNSDSAEFMFKEAELMAGNLKASELKAELYFEYAKFLFLSGRHDEAHNKFQECLLMSEKINTDRYINLSKTFIGTLYMLKSNYNIATKYTLEALEYFERMHDYYWAAGILLNLTYIQIEQADYKKAEEYADLSYTYAVKAKSDGYICKSIFNIGELAFLNGDYEKALKYFNRSFQIADSIHFENFFSTIFLNKAAVYDKLNMTDSAIYYSQKVFDYSSNNDISVFIIPKAYIQLSDIYGSLQENKKAIEYANKAVYYADSAEVFQITALAYDRLSNIYAEIKQFELAYEYKQKSTSIYDSIFNEEKYRIQHDLEMLYETNKKQLEIESLQKENEIKELKNQRTVIIIYLLIFITLIAVLTGVLTIRQNRNKARRESAELSQKLLRSQMNPHFIFNSISSIQNFILKKEPIEASSYLSDFAKLMRAVLMNISESFITLSQEIETVENYLRLQHLRLSDKFDYELLVSNEIDTDEMIIPPMLIQPFIENSIIHGILNKKDGKGIIKVSYTYKDDYLILENEDNGVGRQKIPKKNNSRHESKAVKITEQRIQLLEKKIKQKIDFEIIDLFTSSLTPSGTLVRIKIPTIPMYFKNS